MAERHLESARFQRDDTLISALVVESDDGLRTEFADGLSDYGYDVRCAGDAESAYLVAMDFEPDVILLEWRLPGDAGVLACRRLADLHPSAAIVMLTDGQDLRDRRAAWEAGARTLLVKPVPLPDVADELRRARGSRRFKRSTHRHDEPDAMESEEARRMREAHDRLRLVLDTARDAFVSTDEDGRIEDWNPAAEVLFGWQRSDVLGRRFVETVVPDRLRDDFELEFQRFLEGEPSSLVARRSERTLARRDGEELPVELTVTPMHLSDRMAFSIFVRS